MLAAPINPADINMIQGNYGKMAELPAVGGNEGVGVVEKVGKNVKQLAVGARVVPAKAGLGTWRSHLIAKGDDFTAIPSDIPIEYAACMTVNPATAYRLLNDFVDLKEGDVVIQNGGSSMVAHCVAQLAKERGIKVISVMRERPEEDGEVEERLKSLGSYLVCTETYARTAAFKKLISDLPKPKLALNCVGGSSATELARHLGEGGVLVTYGGMSKKPVLVSTGGFIFKDLTYRGFWMTRWYEKASADEKNKMMKELSEMVKKDKLKFYIETHKLEDWRFAYEASTGPLRNRKVVLQLSDY